MRYLTSILLVGLLAVSGCAASAKAGVSGTSRWELFVGARIVDETPDQETKASVEAEADLGALGVLMGVLD